VRGRSAAGVLAVALLAGCSGHDDGAAGAPSTSPSASSPPPHLVGTFHGSAPVTTGPMTVTQGWELRFQIKTAAKLRVTLLGPNQTVTETLVSLKGPGGGSVFPKTTGKVSLRVVSSGRWVVRAFSR